MCDNAGQPDQIADNGQQRFESFSPRVRGILQDLDRKLKPARAAERMWERLTEEERERLGGDVRSAYARFPSAAMMWAELHRVSQFRAYLEAGRELGFVSDADYHWLMREVGEEEPRHVDPNLPIWNADLGKLYLDGEEVGSFRVMQTPSTPCRILAAFQATSWQAVVDEPLGGDEKSLQDAVRYLNSHVRGIRFRTQRGGRAISWERL